MQKQFSKELPAPLSLKQTAQLDIFAQNTYGNTITPIGLTPRWAPTPHVYLGSHWYRQIHHAAFHDSCWYTQNGKGLALVDPHGD